MELPPRARRIPNRKRLPRKLLNYLRVRGEYVISRIIVRRRSELPPRARRILSINTCLSTYIGTTSACAENTACSQTLRFLDRNYLRVRGEYVNKAKAFQSWKELPPRARRIRIRINLYDANPGTTSACAENTTL